MQKDFSYPLKIDELKQGEQVYKLSADGQEKEFLQKILDVPAVNSFEADIKLKFYKKKERLEVSGCVRANIEQISVVSLDSFNKDYQTEFTLTYDTKASYEDIYSDDDDINIDIPDIIIDGKIDLGDIAIEQLALVMDDYPRKEGEEFSPVIEDISEIKQDNPFALLSKLKK